MRQNGLDAFLSLLKEKNRLLGLVRREGMTLVPMSLYFNDEGQNPNWRGKGRKKQDKREVVKQRDWDRQKQRLLKKIEIMPIL